ncbi:glycosyltransferase [Dokdonella koreensis]|uniref:Glycosyl transferase group 1 n=1 Tax=Dokdonella koreensis DS-123 TaxID=1300342 RepID=A0A160DT89_9GAMM|nr:glycosyltransferase [Dokdonella koreensis]ANB17170.1 Glycosyl transferase group 1 [Dokdonella koreensis DS-123]
MTDPQAALAGRGVVYFGNDWHAENRTSSHHVASRLARAMPVLYVSSPGMRAPQASGRDLRRALRKLTAALRPPTRIEGQLWHCTIPQLPFRRIPGVDAFNRWFGGWAVRRALKAAGIDRRIAWFVVPHPGFLAGRLGEDLCVYYCIDDYAAHPGVDSTRIAACDLALTRAADIVFVAPPALVAAKTAQNPHTVFSPHGVDVDLFGRAADPATPVAEAARGLPHPVIGYFGSIHEWIDLELIEWLARQRPAWTFLLVGHAAVDVARLAALPNVRLAGAQPYATLPQWAKAFDAAIIPYRLNRQVANANPLKLREYLATGKPVVSVRNPEIEKFADVVRLADDRGGFLAALDAAIGAGPEAGAAERRAAVADQTWDRRVEAVLAEVAGTLAARVPPSSR